MVAMATCNVNLKNRGVPTKSITPKLLLTIADLNWYHIKAYTQVLHPMVRDVNDLICILIDKTLKN